MKKIIEGLIKDAVFKNIKVSIESLLTTFLQNFEKRPGSNFPQKCKGDFEGLPASKFRKKYGGRG